MGDVCKICVKKMANSSQVTLSLIHVWRVIEIPHGPTQTQRKTQNHNPCLWSMWKRAILSENSWTAQTFVPSYHWRYRIYVRILRIFYPFIEEITNSQIVSTWIWKAQTVSALWFQITVQSENPKAFGLKLAIVIVVSSDFGQNGGFCRRATRKPPKK